MWIVFLFAAFIGSFINVCIYRIPREESIVFPGSHCPHCQKDIASYDLVPLVSWLWLRGKCRYCGAPISIRYPSVELLTGILVTMVYLKFSLSYSFFFGSYLVLLLIIMTFIDLDYQMIPDGLNVLVATGGVAHYLFMWFINGTPSTSILQIGLGVLLGGGLFLLIAIVSNGGMGGGDIKLMAALGLWFEWKSMLLLMFLSFTIGGILSIILLLTGKATRKQMVPFGPFIAIGAIVTLLFGEVLFFWYSTTFF